MGFSSCFLTYLKRILCDRIKKKNHEKIMFCLKINFIFNQDFVIFNVTSVIVIFYCVMIYYPLNNLFSLHVNTYYLKNEFIVNT